MDFTKQEEEFLRSEVLPNWRIFVYVFVTPLSALGLSRLVGLEAKYFLRVVGLCLFLPFMLGGFVNTVLQLSTARKIIKKLQDRIRELESK